MFEKVNALTTKYVIKWPLNQAEQVVLEGVNSDKKRKRREKSFTVSVKPFSFLERYLLTELCLCHWVIHNII